MAVTRQATSNTVNYTSSLTLRSIIRYKISLADITFLTALIKFSILLFFHGSKEGDSVFTIVSENS